MKQRVLVIGSNDFVGRCVVQALAASDWAEPVKSEQDRPVAAIANCVTGSAAKVLNAARTLAGIAAAQPAPPRIVQFSSIAVYGNAAGPVDEATPPGGTLSPYGLARLEAERLAASAGPAVLLRPGIVYGPGSAEWSERIAHMLFAHRLGDLGRAGDGCCNLLFIDDAATAVVRSLQLPDITGKTFNVRSPEPPTWNEYFTRYALALGAVPVSRVSGRRLRIESKILAPPQKIARLLVGRLSSGLARRLPEPIPPSLLRLFEQDITLKIDRAEQALGLRWTSPEEGLKRTADEYRRR